MNANLRIMLTHGTDGQTSRLNQHFSDATRSSTRFKRKTFVLQTMLRTYFKRGLHRLIKQKDSNTEEVWTPRHLNHADDLCMMATCSSATEERLDRLMRITAKYYMQRAMNRAVWM